MEAPRQVSRFWMTIKSLQRNPDEWLLQAMARRLRQVLAISAVFGSLAWVFVGWLMPYVQAPLGACEAHVALQLRGHATGAGCGATTIDALHESLRRDERAALIYAALIGGLSLLFRPGLHLDRRLRSGSSSAQYAALGAATFDLIENKLMLEWTNHASGLGFVIAEGWRADVVAALAFVKWTLLFVGLVNLVWLVAGGFAERPFPLFDTPARQRLGDWWDRNRWRLIGSSASPEKVAELHDRHVDRPPHDPTRLAVCCSGGGIRSAGFTLGALHELESDRTAERISIIAAVSGGNYGATTWVLRRAAGDPTAANSIIRHLMDGANPLSGQADAETCGVDQPPRASGAGALLRVGSKYQDAPPIRSRSHTGRHRYLANSRGGLARSIVFAVGAVLANFAQLLSVIIPLGWLLGILLEQPDVHPTLPEALMNPTALSIMDRHWQPGVLLILAGAVAASLSALAERPLLRAICTATASALSGVGVLSLIILVVTPWTMVQFARLGDDSGVFTIGGISLVTIAGAVVRLVADPLRRMAPRLGGAVLGFGLLLLFGKVAVDTVDGTGLLAEGAVILAALSGFVLSAFVLDTQTASIRELYRTRLSDAFCEQDVAETTWEDLREHECIPELIVCCAASRIGLAPNGMPAEPFTISQHHVRHYRSGTETCVATDIYTSTLRSLAQRRLRRPTDWMATSGAAFSSAMGQLSLGSTNALLAAVNADLGIWLPSPDRVEQLLASDAPMPAQFPPVRLGHLFNEIFGIYAPNDEQVFVSDGGHVENLGLLELLQAATRSGLHPDHPHTIISIDASGDTPGSFSTLRAALQVADTVLGERLWFDTTELDQSSQPATSSVYSIPFWRWDYRPIDQQSRRRSARVGVIYYVKLQSSLDQSTAVRQFGMIDPKFPNYSTTNQLLDDQQFAFLLTAGRDAAAALRARLRADGVLVPNAEPGA